MYVCHILLYVRKLETESLFILIFQPFYVAEATASLMEASQQIESGSNAPSPMEEATKSGLLSVKGNKEDFPPFPLTHRDIILYALGGTVCTLEMLWHLFRIIYLWHLLCLTSFASIIILLPPSPLSSFPSSLSSSLSPSLLPPSLPPPSSLHPPPSSLHLPPSPPSFSLPSSFPPFLPPSTLLSPSLHPSVGASISKSDKRDLKFLYEMHPEFSALPTFAVIPPQVRGDSSPHYTCHTSSDHAQRHGTLF